MPASSLTSFASKLAPTVWWAFPDSAHRLWFWKGLGFISKSPPFKRIPMGVFLCRFEVSVFCHFSRDVFFRFGSGQCLISVSQWSVLIFFQGVQIDIFYFYNRSIYIFRY